MATETVQTEKVVKEKTPKVEKEKTVKIRLPITKDLKDDVFISVNERTWLIQRGKEVEVPECVAEVLRNQEIQLEQAMLFHESVKHD